MGRYGWWLVGLIAWGASAPALLAQAPPTPDTTVSPAPPGEPGAASSDPLRREASEHFERGVTLFRDGAYRAALIEFERAYATIPDFRLLYNMAQMRMLLQDYLGAKRDYEKYLIDGAEKVPEERREIVERELAILRERVASIVISSPRDGVRVYVDDVLIGETPIAHTVPLNVGRHRVYGEHPDGSTASETLDLAAGELHEVKLELVVPKVNTVVVREGGSERGRHRRGFAIAFTVAAGATFATAIGTAFAARKAQADLEKAIDAIPARQTQIESAQEKSKALSITTDVMGLVAVGTGIVAAVLWIKEARSDDAGDRPRARAVLVRPALGLTSLGVSGRF
jgi:tetratricopeptide (TPR) repeat protein